MKIQCGLNAELEMSASVFAAKNWLYLKDKNSRICIDLNSAELVKGQCHKAPGLSKEQIAKIVSDWKTG